jgi:hypothetical protein
MQAWDWLSCGGGWINAPNIFWGASATVHFHDKLYGFHNFMSSQKNGLGAWSEWRPLLVHRHGYGFEKLATPHSEQRGFTREVINPQDGHILCD